jgi:hypothetical protein
MAKKGFDPKAKAKKQKKIAIGGVVLLIALLAYQGPKTMKMLNPGPPPGLAAQQASTTATTTAPVTPGATPAPATPVGGSVDASGLPPSAADGLVVNADLSPVPLDGQLAALTQFTSKDPFRQQATGTPSAPSGATPPAATTTPASSGSFTPGPGSTTPGPTTPGPTTPGPAAPAPTVATISVNGVEMAVTVKADFPVDAPFFNLVSLTATTAKIGIAGGSLATGSTVTLRKGKAVTLMNTADGTRYILVLISMGDTTTPATAGATGTTTTPATTTTSTTTTTTGG